MEDERQEPISEEVQYTVMDMLAAFRHGRNYEPLNDKYDKCDMDFTTVEEKHRPFFEWIKNYKE